MRRNIIKIRSYDIFSGFNRFYRFAILRWMMSKLILIMCHILKWVWRHCLYYFNEDFIYRSVIWGRKNRYWAVFKSNRAWSLSYDGEDQPLERRKKGLWRMRNGTDFLGQNMKTRSKRSEAKDCLSSNNVNLRLLNSLESIVQGIEIL